MKEKCIRLRIKMTLIFFLFVFKKERREKASALHLPTEEEAGGKQA